MLFRSHFVGCFCCHNQLSLHNIHGILKKDCREYIILKQYYKDKKEKVLMKQVYIITAYKDFDWLKKTLSIYSKDIDCYVHVDKKAKIPSGFKEWQNKQNNVYLYSRYRVNWGGISI